MKSTVLTFLSLLFLVSVTIGCSGKSDTDKPKRMEYAVSAADLPFPKASADTLVGSYAYLVAYDMLRALTAAKADSTKTADADIDKEAFLRGVDIVIADSAASTGYTQGVESATTIFGQIAELRAKGVKINPALIVRGLRETIFTDSVTSQQITDAAKQCNALMVKAYKE